MVVVMRIFLGWATLALISVAGCSSVPDFKPSKPLEEASSLNEALDICASYQITKADKNTSERASAERVVVLVPWLRCFEDIFRKFAVARNHENFVMFFRALQALHDGAHPSDARVIDAELMNHTVRRIVDHLKGVIQVFSSEERLAIERQFPGYSIYLAEHGSFSNPPSTAVVRDERLLELKREVEGTDRASRSGLTDLELEAREKLPPAPAKFSGEQKAYCKQYRVFRGMVYNVEELAQYKKALNQSADITRQRVEERFSSLKKETLDLKEKLAHDFLKLQSSTPWFRNGYCLR